MTALSEEESTTKSELLIGIGANPSVRNDMSETPSHYAAKAGNLETLKLLVEKGGLSGILMGNHCYKQSFYKESKSATRQNSRRVPWPSSDPVQGRPPTSFSRTPYPPVST